MKSIYSVTGMTCEACKYKVEHLLAKAPGVTKAEVNLQTKEVAIESNKNITLQILKEALNEAPKYTIEAPAPITHHHIHTEIETPKSWFETYKPVLLIFFFVTVVSGLAAYQVGHHVAMHWGRFFMAGFFLAFSFFKLLDVKAFAESYAMYDIIAKRIPFYGKIYPFIELALGILFIIYWQPLWVNIFTLGIMSISLAGVLESVLNKKKIRCACLGAVFNLPMSTVTIIEDGLMIVMAAWMIVVELNLLP